MDSKIFKTIDGFNLTVRHTKSFIVLEDLEKTDKYKFNLRFEEEVFKALIQYLKDVAIKLWYDFEPKEATNLRTDYYEYYDRKFDSNGYLTILNNGLVIEKPSIDDVKLYQFNKIRLESFIYDANKLIDKGEMIVCC